VRTFARPTRSRAARRAPPRRRPAPAPGPSIGSASQRSEILRILHGSRLQPAPALEGPADAHETEADRVAERVTGAPTTPLSAPLAPAPVHIAQHASGPSRIQRDLETCEESEECPAREPGEYAWARSHGLQAAPISSPDWGFLVWGFAINSANASGLSGVPDWAAFSRRLATLNALWQVRGFSDCHGDDAHNASLRFRRAFNARQALPPAVQHKVPLFVAAPLTDCLATNGTKEERAFNRAAFFQITQQTLELEGTEVTGERPPEPVPEPEAPTSCPDWQDWLGPVLANPPTLLSDFAECFCLGVKMVDLFDDILARAPVVGTAVADSRVQAVISAVDCLCGVWDLLQLGWDLGRDPGPCWDWSNYDAGDIGRLTLMTGAVGLDCTAGVISELLSSWISELGAEIGGGTGGPPGALLGWVIGQAVERLTQETLELVFDVGAEIAQNYITYGTPFPLDACRSCLRLAGHVHASIDETLCDRWNEALVPEAIRIPEWHQAPSTGEPD